MIRVLRLADTYETVRAALQAWISDTTATVNDLAGLKVIEVTYTQGVSPSPFPVALAGRPRAVWIGACISQTDPATAVAGRISWAYTTSGIAVTPIGLTSGVTYVIRLCVVG